MDNRPARSCENRQGPRNDRRTLLGKVVEYWTSSYHKVPSIADYALKSFPVRRIEPKITFRIHHESVKVPVDGDGERQVSQVGSRWELRLGSRDGGASGRGSLSAKVG